jgi:methionyl-tRNA synthetase
MPARGAKPREVDGVEERQPEPAPSRPAPAGGDRDAVPRITIDRFFETELRVARILSAERIPNADRLLKLEIDLGTERRQLVAGIAVSYAPEALVGKRIVVVANLEPARIRGVESQGMLLAADAGGRPVVVTFDEEVPPGTRVR